jgi:large subunit ribosomal protein L4
MVRLALCSALSDRAAEERIKVVDGWGIDEPRTKQAVEVLGTLGLRTAGERGPRVLIVLDRDEHAVWKSFRNLGKRIQIVLPEELNAYDVLVNDWIVFSTATLDAAITRFSRRAGDDAAVDETVEDAHADASDADAPDADAPDTDAPDTDAPDTDGEDAE